MSTTQSTTDTDRATELAAGLRDLAAMVTEHPHLAPVVRRAVDMRASVGHGEEDARGLIIASARAGLACGATVTEYDGGAYAGVHVAFGPVRVQVYAEVDKVHRTTRRTVEQVDGVTCRITEYTPRSILAELVDTPERAA